MASRSTAWFLWGYVIAGYSTTCRPSRRAGSYARTAAPGGGGGGVAHGTTDDAVGVGAEQVDHAGRA